MDDFLCYGADQTNRFLSMYGNIQNYENGPKSAKLDPGVPSGQ
jgi:hypothetical protein